MRAEPRRVLVAVGGTALAVACFVYLARVADWSGPMGAVAGIDHLVLVPQLLVLHLGYVLARTARWRVATRSVGKAQTWAEAYWASAIMVSLAVVTPGQLGEALKVELLHRRGVAGRVEGIGAFGVERAVDAVVLAGLGAVCVGLLWLAGEQPAVNLALLLSGVLLLVVLVLGGFATLNLLGRRFRVARQLAAAQPRPATAVTLSLLTLASWLLVGAAWTVALGAVAVDVDFIAVLAMMAAVAFATVLSAVPGGLGVADVVALESLQALGATGLGPEVGVIMLRYHSLVVVAFGLVHLGLWFALRPLGRWDE